MSYKVKKKFAEQIDEPEKCLANLRAAYNKHVDLILGKELWKDDGKLFFESDKQLGKWAVEPSQATEMAAMAGMQPPGAALPASSSPFSGGLPGTGVLQSGYPPVIILSVALLSTVFLAYDKIISPSLAVFFGAFGLFLFFAPPIIDRLLKLLPINKMVDKEKTISELFKMAHTIFEEAINATAWVGEYEDSGKLPKDPLAQTMIGAISDLSNIYREIFLRSEKEWYQRALIKQEATVRMANGSGSSTSDVSG